MRITKYDVENNKNGIPILVKETATNYSTDEGLNSPSKIVQMLNDIYHLDKKAEEHVYLIGFNTKFKPIAVFEVSKGTATYSPVNNRELYIRLLLCGATSFVFVHNHPSGDPFPSKPDFAVVEQIKKAASLLGIVFADSIIIGRQKYYSFKEEGNLQK